MATHRILVIDDSMVIRRTVKDMLPPSKFEIIEAKDGVQGMKLIEEGHADLIMLDFFLPKKSGWDVFQEIQKEPRYRMVPLLLMSGRKDEVTEKITEPFEFFSFLEKPFDQGELIQAIRESMEKSKLLREHIGTPSSGQIPSSKDSTASAPEIEKLTAKVAHLESEITHLKKVTAKIPHFESEITHLKKQVHQLITFIKQKLK